MSTKHKQIFREQYELNRNKPNDQTTDDSLPVLLVATLNNKMTQREKWDETIKIKFSTIQYTTLSPHHNTLETWNLPAGDRRLWETPRHVRPSKAAQPGHDWIKVSGVKSSYSQLHSSCCGMLAMSIKIEIAVNI